MSLILCEFHGSKEDLKYISKEAKESHDVEYVSIIQPSKKWIGDYYLKVRVNFQQI